MRLAFGVLLGSFVLGSGPAMADVTGPTGRLVALQLNDPDGDLHSQAHGRLDVETGGQLASYYWGGVKCSAFKLTTPTVEILHGALAEPRLVIQPLYKTQGNNECLVGFRLIHRDWQGLY